MSSDGNWTPIKEGFSVDKFTGELPRVLYRYRSLSDENIARRLSFEVFDEGIFMAAADSLNDPDEGIIRWRVDGTLEEAVKLAARVLRENNPSASNLDILEQSLTIGRRMMDEPDVPKDISKGLQQVVGRLVRIACFTNKPLNGPMWSHYGNFQSKTGTVIPHGGICIEYSVNDDWRNAGLRPVEYCNVRPTVNMLSRGNLESQFAFATRVKTKDWSYEEEWRMVSYLQANNPWVANLEMNSKLRLKGCVKSVILGLNMEPNTSEKIVGQIRRNAPHLSVKKVVRHPTSATLVLSDLD